MTDTCTDCSKHRAKDVEHFKMAARMPSKKLLSLRSELSHPNRRAQGASPVMRKRSYE